MFPPKPVDIFSADSGCTEGLDASRFFFNNNMSCVMVYYIVSVLFLLFFWCPSRLGSSEVPRNPLTRWDVSSIPANGIFLTKK